VLGLAVSMVILVFCHLIYLRVAHVNVNVNALWEKWQF